MGGPETCRCEQPCQNANDRARKVFATFSAHAVLRGNQATEAASLKIGGVD